MLRREDDEFATVSAADNDHYVLINQEDGMRGKGMTAHQLARQLLAGPDDEVMLIVNSSAADWLDRIELDPGGRTVDLHGQSAARDRLL